MQQRSEKTETWDFSRAYGIGEVVMDYTSV